MEIWHNKSTLFRNSCPGSHVALKKKNVRKLPYRSKIEGGTLRMLNSVVLFVKIMNAITY